MSTRAIVPSLLMTGLITLGSPAAMASEELAGALFGAGAGAVLGHIIGGNEGAAVGGIFGAMVGAAVADDDHRAVVAYPRHPVVYAPYPARYIAPPPAWAGPRYGPPQWHHDRDGRWGRRDGRDDSRDHDRGAWGEGPRDYRNY